MTRAQEIAAIEDAIASGKMTTFPYMMVLPVREPGKSRRFTFARKKAAKRSAFVRQRRGIDTLDPMGL